MTTTTSYRVILAHHGQTMFPSVEPVETAWCYGSLPSGDLHLGDVDMPGAVRVAIYRTSDIGEHGQPMHNDYVPDQAG